MPQANAHACAIWIDIDVDVIIDEIYREGTEIRRCQILLSKTQKIYLVNNLLFFLFELVLFSDSWIGLRGGMGARCTAHN